MSRHPLFRDKDTSSGDSNAMDVESSDDEEQRQRERIRWFQIVQNLFKQLAEGNLFNQLVEQAVVE